ncbi:MAG: hypothetical protein Tsb005_07070 [Gammaproteobacteria bacterium]
MGKTIVTLSRFAKQSVSKGLLERVVKAEILNSFEKARNTDSIPALFLNQNVSTACNLCFKFSHREVQWV